jgi:tetratricopeptide (TPR) repeat protein
LAVDRDKILDLAQKYVLKGQPEKAIKEYQKLIKASPKDIRARLKLGDLFQKSGENEKAIEEYSKAGELYVEEDLNFRAIAIYKKILSIDPKRIEALHQIATLYLKEGLKGDARNYYQIILKMRPGDQEALNALKSIRDNQQPKEATRKPPLFEPTASRDHHPAERPVEEEPDRERPILEELTSEKSVSEKSSSEMPGLSSPSALGTMDFTGESEGAAPDQDLEMHYHLGIAYKEMELFDYAISEFEQAASNRAIRFDCYIMLGNCFMEKGAYDKSIEYYKEASEIKGLPNDKLARLHFNLGLAFESNGNFPEAIDSFGLALKLDQSFLEAQEKIKKLRQR